MITIPAIPTLVPLAEYLSTAYEPDCDYLDGEVEERNLGEWDHARIQGAIQAWFYYREKELDIQVVVEQRVQISPTRFRVPDVCVLLGRQNRSRIVQKPPFLCIEILSPEDRLPRMQSRIQDYLNFGVRFVWLIDPESGWAGVYTQAGFQEVTDGVIRTAEPEFAVSLAEIFEAL